MAGLITDLPDGGALDNDDLFETSRLSSSITITATTLSVDQSDNSINDSGSGFLAAGFTDGDHVRVQGFTTTANNPFHAIIQSVVAGKIVLESPEGDALVTEAAGDSVMISKWISARISGSEFAGGGGGSSGVDIEEDGVLVQLGATILNFVGAGVTATDQDGYQVDIEIPGGSGGDGGVDVEQNGTLIQLGATVLNFKGAGVTATDEGGYQVDIDIPGGGGGSWSELYSYDHAVDGNVDSPEITGITANEIVVFMNAVTFSANEMYGFMLSDDNGATWYSSGNPYLHMTIVAAPGSALIRGATSTSTGPRAFFGTVQNMQATVAKFGYANHDNTAWIAPTITTACNAIRIADSPLTDNTITGGTILILGR